MRLRNIPEARETVALSGHVIQLEEAADNARSPVLESNRGIIGRTFGNDRPVHIEIGMGKGSFIMGMAERHPEINYVGIERYESVLIRAVQKMDALEETGSLPGNVKFICMDASEITKLGNKGDIDRIYLNFSDPWPKARHEDRRLTSGKFLEKYEKLLKKDGILEFKTDNRDLFEFSLEEIKSAENWSLVSFTYDLHGSLGPDDENVMTEYEQKFAAIGKKINKLTAVLKI